LINLWLGSPRKKERRPNKIKSERGKTTDTGEKKKIYIYIYDYAQLYANKFDKLEEMNNFLESNSPPKLNQVEIGCLNRPITRSEIESLIKKKKSVRIKVQDQMASQANSTKHTKKNLD